MEDPTTTPPVQSEPPLIVYCIMIPVLWTTVMIVACACVHKAHVDRQRAMHTARNYTANNTANNTMEVQPVAIIISLQPTGVNRFSQVVTADLVLQSSETTDDLCYICYDAEATAVLLRCGHSGLCVQCAQKLKPQLCPICREPIVQTVQLLHRSPDETGVTRAITVV